MTREIMHGVEHIMLGLTPSERWSAASRLDGGKLPEEWFLVGAGIVLLVLVALLVWISHRRWRQNHRETRELFAENALRRGLGVRDRQILLAIVMRSNLRRTQDVFTAADAFDRGALKLLAEAGRTRTGQENDQLRTEIMCLREKLGFQIASPVGSATGLGRPSSREIPVGRAVELIARDSTEAVRLQGTVVRNDEIEIALQLAEPLESKGGEVWGVRYCSGMSAWEFNASTVSCDGHRLILNHSDEIRSINRRRFPRVSVRGRASIALLPFIRGDASTASSLGKADLPAFVQGTLTELAGPGLRLEAPMQFRPGDRVLVVFTLSLDGSEVRAGGRRTVAGIGLVRNCRKVAQNSSIAVELVGLSNAEIDELACMTGLLCSETEGRRDRGASRRQQEPSPAGSVR